MLLGSIRIANEVVLSYEIVMSWNPSIKSIYSSLLEAFQVNQFNTTSVKFLWYDVLKRVIQNFLKFIVHFHTKFM